MLEQSQLTLNGSLIKVSERRRKRRVGRKNVKETLDMNNERFQTSLLCHIMLCHSLCCKHRRGTSSSTQTGITTMRRQGLYLAAVLTFNHCLYNNRRILYNTELLSFTTPFASVQHPGYP